MFRRTDFKHTQDSRWRSPSRWGENNSISNTCGRILRRNLMMIRSQITTSVLALLSSVSGPSQSAPRLAPQKRFRQSGQRRQPLLSMRRSSSPSFDRPFGSVAALRSILEARADPNVVIKPGDQSPLRKVIWSAPHLELCGDATTAARSWREGKPRRH